MTDVAPISSCDRRTTRVVRTIDPFSDLTPAELKNKTAVAYPGLAAEPAGEEVAVDFLEKLRPSGPWTLTAIVPNGKTTTITARTASEVREFVRAHNGKRNLYYAVNPLRTAMSSKAAKTDVAAIEFVFGDFDPSDGETPEQAKERYLAALKNEPEPSALIDSGNGLQGLWRLKTRIALPPPIEGELSPEAAAKTADAEARTKALMERVGAEAGTQNIDRVLRLPGTTNLPTAAKKRKGRVPRQARLLAFNDAAYPLDAFPTSAQQAPGRGKATAKQNTRHGQKPCIDFDNLPDVDLAARPVSDDIKEAIDTDGSELGGGDRSKAVFRVACELVRAGCSDQQIASVLDSKPIGAHCHDQKDPKRAISRAISRARQKADAMSEFDSAEGDKFVLDRGLPSKTAQQNIRSALRHMGVTVRHDIFQDRMTIEGLAGCGPLLDDRAMERLWLTIDERYRFRPVKDFFWTVVGDEAHRHAYHPVRDYLGGLQWDGVPRIDTWLSTYAGAESTPYTDAVGALTLIAAVRRVRRPGCKFDEMPVLEGSQGTDKSTARNVSMILRQPSV